MGSCFATFTDKPHKPATPARFLVCTLPTRGPFWCRTNGLADSSPTRRYDRRTGYLQARLSVSGSSVGSFGQIFRSNASLGGRHLSALYHERYLPAQRKTGHPCCGNSPTRKHFRIPFCFSTALHGCIISTGYCDNRFSKSISILIRRTAIHHLQDRQKDNYQDCANPAVIPMKTLQ